MPREASHRAEHTTSEIRLLLTLSALISLAVIFTDHVKLLSNMVCLTNQLCMKSAHKPAQGIYVYLLMSS
jgi:hypothetical protein